MKTDLSFWTNLNPTLKCVNTKNLFYKQYPYKITLRIIGYSRFKFRKDRSYDITRYPRFYTNDEMTDVSICEQIYQFLENFKIKQRVEGSYLSLYCMNLNELEFIGHHLKSVNKEHYLYRIYYPINDEVLKFITLGKIFVKNVDREMKYRVCIRSGNMKTFEQRRALYNYLMNFDDQIRYGTKFQKNLCNLDNSWWQSNIYFYTKNDDLFVMLKLIAPELIEGIYELVRE